MVRMSRLFGLRNELRNERGQALFILAGAFLALLVLVGLVVDLAVIFVHNGHLRRAVDSAAVAAVSQYRESRTIDQIYASTKEFLEFQLPGVHNVRVYWCDRHLADIDHDLGGTLVDMQSEAYHPHVPRDPGSRLSYQGDTLCSAVGSDPGKRVRVEAWIDVDLFFLPLVGFDQVQLSGWAESEAAVVNMVLLLDTSESMAYGVDSDHDGDVDEDPHACPGDPTLYPRRAGPDSDPANNPVRDSFAECLRACSEEGWCSPFEQVRDSAIKFMANMCDGVDKVAVYHFDKTPVMTPSMELSYTVPITIPSSSGLVVSLTSDIDAVTTDIDNNDKLRVYIRPDNPDYPPGSAYLVGNFKWTNTNIGGGLREATTELVNNGNRDIAVWVIVLLTDGAANATDKAADENGWWTCPSPPGMGGPNERTISPLCRDPEADDADPIRPDSDTVTRHCPAQAVCDRPWYTNSDMEPDLMPYFYDADDYARDMADDAAAQMIAIYTIGFGESVIGYRNPPGRNDAGERLLRYIADVGDDGDNSTAPCGSDFYWDAEHKWPLPEQGEQCGNYYYAEASNLNDVFASIASRLFSRISK